jgi:hypothetical protein
MIDNFPSALGYYPGRNKPALVYIGGPMHPYSPPSPIYCWDEMSREYIEDPHHGHHYIETIPKIKNETT